MLTEAAAAPGPPLTNEGMAAPQHGRHEPWASGEGRGAGEASGSQAVLGTRGQAQRAGPQGGDRAGPGSVTDWAPSSANRAPSWKRPAGIPLHKVA